mgnify:CR=1 FL=1
MLLFNLNYADGGEKNSNTYLCALKAIILRILLWIWKNN